jgi:hypothetical protein
MSAVASHRSDHKKPLSRLHVTSLATPQKPEGATPAGALLALEHDRSVACSSRSTGSRSTGPEAHTTAITATTVEDWDVFRIGELTS